MNRIASRPTRAYRSELREEQAEGTRARILDATMRVMATGLASLSVADTADTVIVPLLERLDSLDGLSRAAMASPVASEVRLATMPTRYERIRRIADAIDPNMRKADRDRIVRLLAVITASSSLRMWRDHLELSVDEVAEEIDWIVRAAIFAIHERKER